MKDGLRFTAVAVAAACLGACHGKSGADGGALVSTTAATSGATVTSALTAPHPTGSASPKGTSLCRAIAVSGPMHRVGSLTAAADAGALSSGELAGDDWIDLGPNSKLSIKNGKTSREAIFEGSGSVRVCVGGEEEMWLPLGAFSSVSGSGEAPGAEQWIITPHGIVRYDAARVRVTAGVAWTDVTLDSGSAWVFPIDAAYRKDAASKDAGREGVPVPKGEDGWVSAPPGQTLALFARRSTSQIVTDCEAAAKAAHELAVAIASNDASLAEAAPKHVRARQKAHAICSVAELTASRTLDLVERERMLTRAQAANALWRSNGG